MKYINRDDRKISHILTWDYLRGEDSKWFHSPLCNTTGILKRESTVTKEPLYRMCKLCLKIKNRKAATCGYYPPNEFA